MELFRQTKTAEGMTQQQQQQKQQGVNTADIISELTTQARKIKLSEEKMSTVRKKVQMLEHNVLLTQKKVTSEVKYLNDQMLEVKRTLEDLKTKMMELAREIQNSARKEDLGVLDRYISMWEPINFVTRREVEKIIDEKLQKL